MSIVVLSIQVFIKRDGKYRLSQVKCVESVGTRFPAIVFKGFLKEKLSLSEMKFKNFKNIFRFNLEKITLYS